MMLERQLEHEAVTKARVLYHIMWPGYTAEAATWEPVENVGLALLEEYEEACGSRRRPRRPRRPSWPTRTTKTRTNMPHTLAFC